MKRLILFGTLFLISFIAFAQTKEITLDDIWTKNTFSPKSIKDIRSLKDGEHYCVLDDNSIIEYSYKTGEKTKTYFDKESAKSNNIQIDNYEFSPNETKILITTNTKMIYRHSFTAKYYIWDIKLQKLIPLSDKDKQQLASFSTTSDKIAFVFENNIYIKDLNNNNEEQITNDGKKRSIIYGSTDWVYEEELGITKAFQWSPDGKKLAYYRFDESNVREYEFPVYGEPYPEKYKYKYPKPGVVNSIVNIFVYDLNTKSQKLMDTGNEIDQYLPGIKWTNEPHILSIQKLNRHQNKLEILLADANNGSSKVIYNDENDTYVEVPGIIAFLKDNKGFILTNGKDGYNHIYYYDMQGKLINQITQGNWDVEEFKGIDEKNNLVYYISDETSPLERNLYSIRLNGKEKKRLTSMKGTYSVNFSSNYKYYIQSFSDANIPPVVTVNFSNGKEIRAIETNTELVEKMKDYGFTKKEFFTFRTSEGIELNGYMIKPPDFNPSNKYPVFMEVYGGPGSQTVIDRWGGVGWQQLLAQKGYILVSVDNRGTGGRGEEFKKCTYMQLGKLESDDQIEAAKYLGSLLYIDAARIGIWGWSYGGFMSSLCITKGADVFKMAIAVAPVTNWRYYDNIYTERFMHTPLENPEGYDNNSPMNYAKNLKGKFLLIHGLNDDNVHFQNSAEFVMELIKENKQFDSFFFPNKNHFINGGNTRLYLYTKMTDYILHNL